MGYVKLMAAVMLTALFAVVIMNFAADFGSDNNTDVQIGNDGDLVAIQTQLETDVDTFTTNTNSTATTFDATQLETGDSTSISGGQFKGGVVGAANSLKQIIGIAYTKIFGSEQGNSGFGIVLTTLLSFIGFLFLVYMYKAWVGRNPD